MESLQTVLAILCLLSFLLLKRAMDKDKSPYAPLSTSTDVQILAVVSMILSAVFAVALAVSVLIRNLWL